MLFSEGYFESSRQEDLEAFLADYRGLTRPPGDEGAGAHRHYQLGRAFEKIGLFGSAIDSYRKSILSDPRHEPSHSALIDLYERFQLHYCAKETIRKYVRESVGRRYGPDALEAKDRLYPHKTVTLYIPCFNAARFIGATIESALEQSYPIDEIMVVDDGSTDDSVEVASRYNVRLLRHDGNQGLSAARNTAIANALGEMLAAVDSDVVLDRYWLERLMLSFTGGNVAGVSGRLIEKNTVTVSDRWRQVRMFQDHGDAVLDGVNLNGSNNVFRMDVLKQVGGYNKAFRTNFEDMDLCNRVRRQGYTTRYIPGAVCRHMRTDSLRGVVNTCYNWRKPVFEVSGAYEDMEKLKAKSINDIGVNLDDICKQMNSFQYDIMYPNFLSCIKTLFKDLHEAYVRAPGFEKWNTIKAAYIILIYLLKTSNLVSDRLLSYILEDINDIVSVLNIEGKTGHTADLKTRVLSAAGTGAEIGKILAGFNANSYIHMDYLSKVFAALSGIFNLDPLVFTMAETSARRVRHEEANTPYRAGPRVMLLNPPWYTKERRGVRAGSRWPFTSRKFEGGFIGYNPYPFFMGYLSSMLTEKGVNNIIVDAIAEDLTYVEFIERVAGFGPDVIVMETSTASFLVDSLWLLKIKERLPAARVIWVGPQATARGKDIIRQNPFVDFIIQGEYERAGAELIEALIEGGDPAHIKGLLYVSESGDIVDNGRSDPIDDLDALPRPERLLVPIYKYNDLFAGMKYPNLQVHASRGCPFGCIYCVWPQVLYGGKKYRVRDPKKVVDELEAMVREYGFRSIYFDDDTFNIGKKRMLELCEEMVRRGLNIPWGAMARADTSDYETLASMKRAGLVGIKFGVESGVQELVDMAGKGLDLRTVRDAVRWCRELGIKTHLTFTFGLPGETRETIRKTIDFAKEMNPDTIQFSITTPFPGTEYYRMLKERGNLLTEEWDKFDGGLHTVIRTDSLGREDLEDAVKLANRKFAAFKARCA